jgi:uncharacterized iron-regulated membrane protein
MNFRKPLFWLHLLAGIAAGVVILVMSVTGVLLTYERQMVAWAERRMHAAPPATSRLPVETLLAKAAESRGGKSASSLTLQADPSAPAQLAFGREGLLFLNPYTGQVLGEGAKGLRAFFRSVTDWHRWLATGPENRAIGRGITGAANLAFLVLILSGLYLWWPRQWTTSALRSVMVPSVRLRGRARHFNWHNAFGFWAALPLLVMVLTGAVFSYPWANDLLFRLTGTEPPPRRSGSPAPPSQPPRTVVPSSPNVTVPTGLNAMWAQAATEVVGWRSIQLRMPASPSAPVTFVIDRGNGARPDLRTQISFDQKTGAISSRETYESTSLGRRARAWVRWLHTGEAGGIVGQTAAGIASLAGAILVWTGVALALRRFRQWRKTPLVPTPGAKSQAPATSPESTAQ